MPQLAGSVAVVVHVLPQAVCPVGQVQMLPWQLCPAPQAVLQAPQWALLVEVLTQEPPQSVVPAAQPHAPLVQA